LNHEYQVDCYETSSPAPEVEVPELLRPWTQDKASFVSSEANIAYRRQRSAPPDSRRRDRPTSTPSSSSTDNHANIGSSAGPAQELPAGTSGQEANSPSRDNTGTAGEAGSEPATTLDHDNGWFCGALTWRWPCCGFALPGSPQGSESPILSGQNANPGNESGGRSGCGGAVQSSSKGSQGHPQSDGAQADPYRSSSPMNIMPRGGNTSQTDKNHSGTDTASYGQQPPSDSPLQSSNNRGRRSSRRENNPKLQGTFSVDGNSVFDRSCLATVNLTPSAQRPLPPQPCLRLPEPVHSPTAPSRSSSAPLTSEAPRLLTPKVLQKATSFTDEISGKGVDGGISTKRMKGPYGAESWDTYDEMVESDNEHDENPLTPMHTRRTTPQNAESETNASDASPIASDKKDDRAEEREEFDAISSPEPATLADAATASSHKSTSGHPTMQPATDAGEIKQPSTSAEVNSRLMEGGEGLGNDLYGVSDAEWMPPIGLFEGDTE
jgi:hypothetical protein